MTKYELVVADAGPLVALFRIEQAELLKVVARRVVVPQVVVEEMAAGPRHEPAAVAARTSLPPWMEIAPERPLPPEVLALGLDAGEAAAIAEALTNPPAALLIDERDGRAAATKLSIPLIGSLGVLLAAKREGVLAEVTSLVQALLATDYFYSSDLVTRTLNLAGEGES